MIKIAVISISGTIQELQTLNISIIKVKNCKNIIHILNCEKSCLIIVNDNNKKIMIKPLPSCYSYCVLKIQLLINRVITDKNGNDYNINDNNNNNVNNLSLIHI